MFRSIVFWYVPFFCNHNPVHSSFMTCLITGLLAGTVRWEPLLEQTMCTHLGACWSKTCLCFSGAPELIPVFSGARIAQFIVFRAVFCRPLFAFLSVSKPFYCRSIDFRLLVISLVSIYNVDFKGNFKSQLSNCKGYVYTFKSQFRNWRFVNGIYK